MCERFAGVDWGGFRHQLAVVDAEGRVLLNRPFAHDRQGLIDLRDELDRRGDCVPVAVERAEGLLVESLMAWGHQVFPISPRIAARTRERYRVAATKDDSFDAYVLADSLRQDHHRWRPLTPSSSILAELRALCRDRRRLSETQRTVESQLRSALDTYHPAVTRLFSSLDRGITLAFLRDYPTPEKAAVVGVGRMRRFLTRHSYSGHVSAEELTERLHANLMAAGPGTTAAESRMALVLADQLELLNRQLREQEKAIAGVFAEHPDAKIFSSFPRAGPIVAACLLAEIGEDRNRFPTPEVLLAEAGLAPVTRSSGKVTRVRFRYAANRRLRDVFTWWAMTQIRIDPWSQARYQGARERGHRHYRALRTINTSWARILWACWANNTPYNPALHTARSVN